MALNYEVKLRPEYNPISGFIDYRYEKYFNLDKIQGVLDDINVASLQVDLKFA